MKTTLAPHWSVDTVDRLTVKIEVSALAVENGQAGLHFPDQAYGGAVPFADYHDLQITDDLGPVSFVVKPSPSRSTDMIYQGVYFDRAVSGEVKWTYDLTPRVLPASYRSSPYYDFRNETGGLNGCGLFALMMPNTEEKMQVSWHWDLTEMPASTRALWSYGEGDVKKVLSPYEVAFSLFNVGVMNSRENESFGIYWYGELETDVDYAFNKLSQIFDYMKKYFHDEDSVFRVFLRRDPFEHSGGGSACKYAFISGYSAQKPIKLEEWIKVLIHEITHTWPAMDDTVVGQGTWFEEGCTEYYCTVLPARAGLVSPEFTVEQINEITQSRYYQNVHRNLPADEIPKIQWQDRRAQPVPYGRGMVYLGNVDQELRSADQGSIDDFVAQFIKRPDPNVTDWLAFVTERLGDKGQQEFVEMMAGKTVIPLPGIFGEKFEAVKYLTTNEDDQEIIAYRWQLK